MKHSIAAAVGVQCAPMATDAPASAPSPSLPPVGAYLRALFDLGRRSIVPALPALVFLWFYRFGTGLYFVMAREGSSPLGFHDERTLLVQAVMGAAAFLPLLVLVHAPFLPLQDSLLRGERRNFLDAIKHVLERMIPFALSVLLQLLIAFGPIALVGGILIAALAPVPDLPKELVLLILVAGIVPVVLWILAWWLFLLFATPGVILSDLGAARAIAASVRLVGGHVWGIFGRFLLFSLVLIAIVMAASIPVAILGAVGAAAAHAEPLFRLLSLLWTSLVTALTFPFGIAATVVLYRALVPAPAAAAPLGIEGEAAPEGLPPGAEPLTPYPFE